MDLRVPLDPIFDALGVSAVVTPPNADAITTTGVWLSSLTEDLPVGRDFQRRDPRRVLAFSLAEVGSVPRGTLVEAAEVRGGPTKSWKVDGIDHQDAELVRTIVVPIPA